MQMFNRKFKTLTRSTTENELEPFPLAGNPLNKFWNQRSQRLGVPLTTFLLFHAKLLLRLSGHRAEVNSSCAFSVYSSCSMFLSHSVATSLQASAMQLRTANGTNSSLRSTRKRREPDTTISKTAAMMAVEVTHVAAFANFFTCCNLFNAVLHDLQSFVCAR